jgi:hypothetical protein
MGGQGVEQTNTMGSKIEARTHQARCTNNSGTSLGYRLCHCSQDQQWFADSVDAKIQLANKRALGCRIFELYRVSILLYCGNLELNPRLPIHTQLITPTDLGLGPNSLDHYLLLRMALGALYLMKERLSLPRRGTYFEVCMKKNHVLMAATLLIALVMLTGCQSTRTVSSSQPRVPAVWPTVSAKEADVRSYFDANRGKLDPIEGIYSQRQTVTVSLIHPQTSSLYRIAILDSKAFQVTNEPSYEFVAVILESENSEWSTGRVKAYFRKTAYVGFYEAKWFMGDYSSKKRDFLILDNGVVYSKEERTEADVFGYPKKRVTDETSLLRIYPLFE